MSLHLITDVLGTSILLIKHGLPYNVAACIWWTWIQNLVTSLHLTTLHYTSKIVPSAFSVSRRTSCQWNNKASSCSNSISTAVFPGAGWSHQAFKPICHRDTVMTIVHVRRICRTVKILAIGAYKPPDRSNSTNSHSYKINMSNQACCQYDSRLGVWDWGDRRQTSAMVRECTAVHVPLTTSTSATDHGRVVTSHARQHSVRYDDIIAASAMYT